MKRNHALYRRIHWSLTLYNILFAYLIYSTVEIVHLSITRKNNEKFKIYFKFFKWNREWINWINFTLWLNVCQAKFAQRTRHLMDFRCPTWNLSRNYLSARDARKPPVPLGSGSLNRFQAEKNTNLYVVNFNLLQPSQKFTLRAFDFHKILIKLSSCSRSRSLDGSSLTATPVRFVHESTQNKKSAELRSLLPFVVYLFHFSARGENFIYFRWVEHSFWLLKNIYFPA